MVSFSCYRQRDDTARNQAVRKPGALFCHDGRLVSSGATMVGTPGAITREKKAATERGDNRDGDWRNARGLAGRASHGSRAAYRMVYWRLGIVLAGGA